MTFAVVWALKANYLSICLSISFFSVFVCVWLCVCVCVCVCMCVCLHQLCLSVCICMGFTFGECHNVSLLQCQWSCMHIAMFCCVHAVLLEELRMRH